MEKKNCWIRQALFHSRQVHRRKSSAKAMKLRLGFVEIVSLFMCQIEMQIPSFQWSWCGKSLDDIMRLLESVQYRSKQQLHNQSHPQLYWSGTLFMSKLKDINGVWLANNVDCLSSCDSSIEATIMYSKS